MKVLSNISLKTNFIVPPLTRTYKAHPEARAVAQIRAEGLYSYHYQYTELFLPGFFVFNYNLFLSTQYQWDIKTTERATRLNVILDNCMKEQLKCRSINLVLCMKF